MLNALQGVVSDWKMTLPALIPQHVKYSAVCSAVPDMGEAEDT